MSMHVTRKGTSNYGVLTAMGDGGECASSLSTIFCWRLARESLSLQLVTTVRSYKENDKR